MRTPSWPHTARIIIYSLLIGGVSGVLGTALTNNYLSNYTFQLNQITEPLRLAQERPRALPASYEDAVLRLEERALPAVGMAYNTESQTDEGFVVQQADATVLTLTSDGWLLTQGRSLRDLVAVGDQECIIDEIVEDPRSGMQFVHCPSSSLPVVDFAEGYALQAGDQVFIAQSAGSVTAARIQQISWGEDIVRSSDTPLRRLELDVFTTSDMQGAPVFNIFGELIGFMGDQAGGEIAVVPFEHISGVFQQVLEGQEEITFPALGVNTIELARMVGMSETLTGGARQGALLYGDVATQTGSVADEAGLAEGDIITAVDGIAIDASLTLADSISRYQAGDVITLEILRDGERADTQVTLGSLTL